MWIVEYSLILFGLTLTTRLSQGVQIFNKDISNVRVEPASQLVPINGTTTFKCFGGPQNRQVGWTYNDMTLPSNALWSTKSPDVLIIERAQPYNLGHYICHVRDRDGYTVGHSTGFLRVDVRLILPDGTPKLAVTYATTCVIFLSLM